MDQGANDIRQDIDSTRATLNDKINTLEAKASEIFDLKHQVAERPWLMLGAAVATGYVLGSLIGDDDDDRSKPSSEFVHQSSTSHDDYRNRPASNYTRAHDTNTQYRYYESSTPPSESYAQQPRQPQAPSQDSFFSQFDDEIDMLKAAAIEAIRNLLHDTIREYAPAIGQQLDQMRSQQSGTASNSGGMSQNLSGNSPGSNASSLSQTYDSTPSTPTTVTRDSDYVKTYYPSS